jgi:pyroglutamyl-peptidase
MTAPVALVTGFEPYGGRRRNPAGEIAERLDGAEIGGVRVVGRNLPVAFGPLEDVIAATVAGLDPAAGSASASAPAHQ